MRLHDDYRKVETERCEAWYIDEDIRAETVSV
jgi:hypothetical protein